MTYNIAGINYNTSTIDSTHLNYYCTHGSRARESRSYCAHIILCSHLCSAKYNIIMPCRPSHANIQSVIRNWHPIQIQIHCEGTVCTDVRQIFHATHRPFMYVYPGSFVPFSHCRFCSARETKSSGSDGRYADDDDNNIIL